MKQKQIVTAVIALSTAFASTSFAADPQFSPEQVKQIEQIVHHYIVTQPEVLIEASKTLQAQQEKKMEGEAMSGIKQNVAKLFNSKTSPTSGPAAASVTVVEFYDYQCGHCKSMAPMMQKLESNKSVRIVYKELPIFGGMSQYAAEAALAANQQGKFLKFHDALFNAGQLTKDSIIALAKQEGLNTDTLKKDMTSAAVKDEIQANFTLAQDLKLMGTPAFVFTNKAQNEFKIIPGATSEANLNDMIKKLQ